MADPYADGVLYDLEYGDYREDVPFYVARAAAHPLVLELGCGTGRLTIPMARAGAAVVGVDRSAPMLAGLRERLAAESPSVRARITVRDADYLAPLGNLGPFSLVIWPFNALHHCADLAEVEAVLRAAHAHTAQNGELALDCYLPAPHLFRHDPSARHEYRWFIHPQTGERLESWERDEMDELRHIHHVFYTYQRPNGEQLEVHLALRMFDLVDIRRVLARSGWRLVHEAQDFEGTRPTPSALKWVGVARRV